MTAENGWKRIKHTHLHHLVHPRLDQLVHILIYDVTPTIEARLAYLDPTFRWGRAREETTWQKGFHAAWNAMLKKPVSGKHYKTDIKNWTCSCGQQKYDAYHLCKHLVQAVGVPSNTFWVQIYRRRTMPIYRHPELVPIGEPRGTFNDLDDGCITDGDDVVWSGDKEVLGSGLWRDTAKHSVSALGKRMREGDGGRDGDSSQMPRLDGSVDAPSTVASLSGDVPSDDDDEEAEARSKLIERAKMWKEAAEIAIEQAGRTDNTIWVKSVLRRGVGEDVEDLVKDVRRYKNSNRNRDTTWATADNSCYRISAGFVASRDKHVSV
ncbi:hypothetical protein B0H13DRAFT_2278738 [Mycena leptocephala]|nr:hypothetical protein B0H13DRAFT_2278738 [Mycena leptocephala]